MKLFGLIVGSVLLGLAVAASIKPDRDRVMRRHFRKLERAGLDRYESYGGGI
jgi:hypothetical protein